MNEKNYWYAALENAEDDWFRGGYNKIEKAHTLISKMREGKNIALITDAGTPGISDPGEELVLLCYESGIEVTSLPGVCACVTALTLSGLPTRRFCFEAFLPQEKKERQEILEELKTETRTTILYEAPHRLLRTLTELLDSLGDRKVTVCRELTKKMEVTPAFLGQQLDSIFKDIRPDAVKIGMVSSGELIRVIAEKLIFYKAENIVLDPVMVATSGSRLISEEAVTVLKEKLLPLASLITPNIPESEVLWGESIRSPEDMEAAAKEIGDTYHCAVLCKGGHQLNDANDLLYAGGKETWFYGKRIDNPNTHGTGCTLSSAIASNLARGCSMEKAVKNAKNYISGALSAMLDLGAGSGPMNHAFAIGNSFSWEE